MRRGSRGALGLAIGVLALSLAMPVANGASPSYLTTALTQSAIRQATISGYNGVIVNYTNTYSSSFGAFVYLDLVNSAGQAIYWNVGYCSFSAHQEALCFVLISSAVPKGNYTAWVFATTNSSIPVSLPGSLKVTI